MRNVQKKKKLPVQPRFDANVRYNTRFIMQFK